ncbi:MafI family immunity protein [Kutzneria chonburiensis]|uniref:MafI family immunity protein n=1 Tax=Kutzneria chonburiensis TaxID=1483604 RepID=A0ABV6MZK5_9PSEU|nr:MafI family immunity protein [Kutzneria chonburiensis]
MQPWDETVFDELCALLPAEQAADARDYLDHNESALAFETAVDHLSEESVPISAALRGRIAEAAASSKRVLDSLPYCPDVDRPRWRKVEDTMEGLEIGERLPSPVDVAWLACNRCPEVLFRYDSQAALMGKVPYRQGILLADGGVEEVVGRGVDRLERCWL